MDKPQKKMGRPSEDRDYRKVLRRFSAYEDALVPLLDQFESKKDRRLIEQVLESFKSV